RGVRVAGRPWDGLLRQTLHLSMLRLPRPGAPPVRDSSESAVRGAISLAELVVKPGPGEGPVAVGGPGGEAQDGGGLLQPPSREEAELDQLGTEGVLPGQLLQGLVHGREVVRGLGDGEVDLVEAEPAPIAAALEAAPGAGAVQQDAAHGFGDGGEEMP